MGILSAFRFAFQNLFFTPILYGVIASLAVFSTVWDNGDRFKDQITDRFRSQDDTFDFIVVGGGSAGAVVANRLSTHHTVLLLEAGGESHPFQAIPGLAIFLSKQPGTDWIHKSVPQTKSCFACRHKKYFFSQGKNIGGSGNLNYLIYLRGSPPDFDNWETITGDPRWSYEGVLPHFRRSEHFFGETTDKTAHGYDGPLYIQRPDCVGLAEEWNHAGREMGYLHLDLNGRHGEGFDTTFYPIKNGVRQATYRAYIQPVRNRPTLLIRKFAHVNKILIREGTNEAYGVEYDRHGHKKFAFANKEVILSAGALHSPKLLILSGVGQLEHLKALNIPVKSILPVGKNLQDHFSTLLGPFYINKPKTISLDRDIDKQSFVEFAASGKGPLTTTGFQATALLASNLAKAQGHFAWPDIQLNLFGLTPHRMFYSDIAHAFGLREDILRKYYGDTTGKEDAFFIQVSIARPLSKGDLCLSSKSPYKAPVIQPGYIDDPLGHDIKVMIEGIHRALFIAENTTVFRALETVYSEKCFPGCENIPFRSDAYWECYLRSFSIAMNDHVGTCPMGKPGSPYAVVDTELRVQGTKHLRVIDASVMPTIVGGPTQAATIMIAEQGSAMILEKWKDAAKTFYGPPGSVPGPLLTTQYGPPGVQYGPPGKLPGGGVISAQYGPPGKPGLGLNPQYGPPIGISPPPVKGGDGFENYDSFAVIRDQLNPKPGLVAPGTTSLIPLQPGIQVWSSPSPFPATVTPVIRPVSSTAVTPLFSPEPSQLLIPPEDHIELTPDSLSYATGNPDFSGSFVSTTANYNLDASRSEQTYVANGPGSDRADTPDGGNGTRQGKSFEGTVPPIPEGNQLGHGTEQGILPSSTPTPFTFVTTPGTTPQTQYKEISETEYIDGGPDFRIVRKRIRTTPRVVVHPRGHLGHQNVKKSTPLKLNESLEALFLTTSSVRPVPKDIITIRKRRPVPFRRFKPKTTPPPHNPTTVRPPEESYQATVTVSVAGNELSKDFEYTTPLPSHDTHEGLPPPPTPAPTLKRLRGNGQGGRRVRKKLRRPANFNGEKRLRSKLNINRIDESPTISTDIAAASSQSNGSFVETPEGFQERLDLDADSSTISNENTDDFVYEYDEEEDAKNETTIITGVERTINGTEKPVVVFKNIELEDTEDLTRQPRSGQDSRELTKRMGLAVETNKDHSNLLGEESRNPIMVVDLNPIPEIMAVTPQQTDSHDKKHDTVAVATSAEYVESKGDKESASVFDDDYYYENSGDDDYAFTNTTSDASSSTEIDKLSNNNSNSLTHFESENEREERRNFSISTTTTPRGRSPVYVKSSSLTVSQSTTSTSSPDTYEIYDYDEPSSTTPKSTSTLNPRLMFRLRNKLIRNHL